MNLSILTSDSIAHGRHSAHGRYILSAKHIYSSNLIKYLMYLDISQILSMALFAYGIL